LPVIPVYVLDEARQGEYTLGKSSKWWLHHSLKSLEKKYSDNNHKLYIHKGDTMKILADYVKNNNIKYIAYNKSYEPFNRDLEKEISDLFKSDAEVKPFEGNILFEPWKIAGEDGTMEKRFTPYFRQCQDKYPNIRGPVKTD
jgi:deoxyribodipyrimidine photo-lyase